MVHAAPGHFFTFVEEVTSNLIIGLGAMAHAMHLTSIGVW